MARGPRRKAPDHNKSDLVSCKDCRVIYTKDTKRGRPICRFQGGKLIIEEGDEYWDEFNAETENGTHCVEETKF